MASTRRSLLALLLCSLAAASTVACGSSSGSGDDVNASPDNLTEENLTADVTRLGSKLPEPGGLTAYGDNVYFTTTYGYATQEEAEYNHDIWVKGKSGAAKRLIKGIYGATWGMVATKNGLYEINEGSASVVKYPLDGSKKDGENLYHAVYGNDETPEVGILQLAADDDGIVLALRSSDDNAQPGNIVALSPAGKNEKKLGAVPGGATALKIEGTNVYVGTSSGDVLVAARDGSGSLKKIASGEGKVASIAVAGDDVFFGTDKALYAKRKGGSTAEKLLAEGAGDLAVLGDSLLYGQYKKGTYTIPLAGGASKLVLKSGAPTGILPANGFIYITDASLGACHSTDEGQACDWDGSVFRVKN